MQEDGTIAAVTRTIELTTPGTATPIVITGQVERLVRASGITTGIVALCGQGVGAAVFCLEGDDTRLGVWTDRLGGWLTKQDPEVAAQLLSQMYGQSLVLPIERSNLLHDPWQQIVLVDFGPQPRRRLITVQMLGDK
jgi:thiamine phosphate synthase YjbQ (UPF0047 family)